jgi:hypothetical protein
MIDPVKNFGKGVVSTGYNEAAITIVLKGGHGARFPDPLMTGPYNLLWWNSGTYQLPDEDPNREIVQCIYRSNDTLTIKRAQEGTFAKTHNAVGKHEVGLIMSKKTIDSIRDTMFAATGVWGNAWDGNVTLNGGTTTLTRDMYYDTLTMTNSAVLVTAGYRIIANKIIMDLNSSSRIHNNGSYGTDGANGNLSGSVPAGGTGGAGGGGGSLPAGPTGGDGANSAPNAGGTAGGNGTSVAKSIGVLGASGGDSGASIDYSGNSGGSPGSKTGTEYSTFSPSHIYMFMDAMPSPESWGGSTGSGGGASSGANVHIYGGTTYGGAGGGAGGTGGIVLIFTKILYLGNTCRIESKGGAGGYGGYGLTYGGGGGGGGGGSGGVVILVYGTKNGNGTIVATGGGGGGGGTSGNASAGQAGDDGNDGSVIEIQV